MILTKTPLRISLAGGGSDLPEFFEKHQGAVVSATIDRSIYITIHNHFDPEKLRVAYSKTEIVDHARELEHDLVRSALESFGVLSGLEISSLADIPSKGSGLGSSSAYMVGLLKALYEGKNWPGLWDKDPELRRHVLANSAYVIERSTGALCGKQDHYAAAFGGFNLMHFKGDDVEVQPLFKVSKPFDWLHKLESHLMLLYVGQRENDGVLSSWASALANDPEAVKTQKEIADLALHLADNLIKGNWYIIGEVLAEGWRLKRSLHPDVSMVEIDALYDLALDAGAMGGKLMGAGSGGFLLIFADPSKHQAIAEATGLRLIPFKFVERGSEVVYGD